MKLESLSGVVGFTTCLEALKKILHINSTADIKPELMCQRGVHSWKLTTGCSKYKYCQYCNVAVFIKFEHTCKKKEEL